MGSSGGSHQMREDLGRDMTGFLGCLSGSVRVHLLQFPLPQFFLPSLGDQEVLEDFLLSRTLLGSPALGSESSRTADK